MSNRRVYLHFLLITALTAALYPLSMLLSAWSGKSSLFSAGMTGVLLLCTWLGTLHILLIRRQYRKKTRLVNGSLWAMTVLLFFLCCFFAPYPSRMVQVVYGIAAGGCYYGAARLVFHPLEHLTHPYVFAGLCIWDVFTGVLLYLCHSDTTILPVVLIFAVNAALFALVHNENAMDRMLSGRGEEIWEMPQEIRRSNTKQMILLCLIGLMLVCCYRPLASLMQWLWRWIYTGSWYAIRWLLSLGGTSEELELPEDTPEQLMTLPQNTTSVWIRIAIEFVFVIGVLALVIWKRHEIGNALVQGWRALRHWIASHLGKYDPLPEESESGAYYDFVEDLLNVEKSLSVKPSLHTRSSWNRAYRRYRHMPPDAARYRFGYALALAKLPEDTAKPSDSPEEILAHLHESGLANDRWEAVTQGYNLVRYGEMQPDSNAFAVLDAILKQMEREM